MCFKKTCSTFTLKGDIIFITLGSLQNLPSAHKENGTFILEKLIQNILEKIIQNNTVANTENYDYCPHTSWVSGWINGSHKVKQKW